MIEQNLAKKVEHELGDKLGNMELRESPLTLLTIDEDSLKKILERADFKSILNLRKVCRPLRNFLEEEKSDINLEYLMIDALPNSIHFVLAYRGLSQTINYKKMDDGCVVELLQENELINSKNINMGYCAAFLNDFKTILDHQKSTLEFLRIRFEDAKTDDQILNGFLKCFKLRSSKLKVEHAKLLYKDRLVSIIPFLQPVTLKKIEMQGFHEELDYCPLLELEQFKHAKRLASATVYTSTPLSHFTHFVSVNIKRTTITLDDVKFLKETFLSNQTIERFSIHLESLKDHKQEIYDFLGPDLNPMDRFRKEWEFKIPGSNHILNISFQESVLFVIFLKNETQN